MDEIDLLEALHRESFRQGPGGKTETQLAITMSGLSDRQHLKIADIGCGTGASTITLAKSLHADITAVDFLPVFLRELEQRAKLEGVSEQITTLAASMDALNFEPSSLDAIWSEGAIYNIGFEEGIRSWRQFLKPEGILAVSELTWSTEVRPAELDEHWSREYPEVATASEKLKLPVVRQSNYYGFRAAEPLQGKAPLAGNGVPIVKSCNAAMDRLCGSLRARLSAPADCVALPRRRTTMPSKERLAANADSHAEPAIIRLTDHQRPTATLR